MLREPDGSYREAYATGACSASATPFALCGGDADALHVLTERRALVLEPAGSEAVLGVFDADGLAGALALWVRPGCSLRPHGALLARASLQLSPALGMSSMFERMKALHLNTLKGLSAALNAKDYYTLGHAARVSTYAVLLLSELGWDAGQLGPCADPLSFTTSARSASPTASS